MLSCSERQRYFVEQKPGKSCTCDDQGLPVPDCSRPEMRQECLTHLPTRSLSLSNQMSVTPQFVVLCLEFE